MNKKLQVFVSSTYTDLIEERQVAVEAILDAGHIPAGMELFKAGRSQMKSIRKWIDESDAYVLILGGRYGSLESESGLSYTELEYNYAISKHMPVFAIILDESFLYNKASECSKEDVFEKDNIDKYNMFKENVRINIVKFAKNSEHISAIIHAHLNDILKDEDYHLVGWSRNSSLESKSMNFNALSKVLKATIVYINKNLRLNANDILIQNIFFFNMGIESSKFPNATLLVLNGILDIIKGTQGQEDILKLSKLGSEYYNYLILHEGYTSLEKYPVVEETI